MNKNALFVFFTSYLFAGCAGVDVDMTGIGDCHVQSIVPEVCTGPNDKPKVTFNTNTLKANPPNVCAEPGTTLEIKIEPAGQNKLGSVAVIPKDIKFSWLSGSNSSDKTKIKIPIPDWVALGPYEYGFVTFDGKCLDPRVSVE